MSRNLINLFVRSAYFSITCSLSNPPLTALQLKTGYTPIKEEPKMLLV